MFRNRLAIFGLILAGLTLVFLTTAPPATAATPQSLALIGATVYSSPTAPPMTDAVVLTANGVITAVGKRAEIKIPKDARVIDCAGKTIVAGFWNSHIHLTESAWNNAATAPAATLEMHMQEMLTRWGFTTVWDLGSDPQNSLALRGRVESGEVPGPQILLAGDIFPKGGHPVYLPAEMQLPEAATSEEAAKMARYYLSQGLDGIKLFTGTFMGDKPVINMDVAIVKAAVEVAHTKGKPVFAHPQNPTGADNALAGGVDILAHTLPSEPDYTPEELSLFKSQHTALIPTLTLWTTVVPDPTATAYIVQHGVTQLKSFSADNGNRVLFGTDVGFIHIYDTSLEYEFMHRALSAGEILASLTTNPAAYFKADKKGRVEKGLDADLVVLDADPVADVHNLAKVAYTIRAGQIIYQK
ncbi:MAG: amidohydrolase family protein [Terriglobales bacterium]|jgi:imidazolonepropionase-like amidohydrolase